MFGNRQWFLPTGCSRLLPGIQENSIQHVHTRKAADDQMWCKLGILPAWCKFFIKLYQATLIVSSSCIKSVKIRLQLDIYWLTWVVETTCIKLVDKKLWQSICIKHTGIWQLAADLLPARAMDELDDCKGTSLQQIEHCLGSNITFDLEVAYIPENAQVITCRQTCSQTVNSGAIQGFSNKSNIAMSHDITKK